MRVEPCRANAGAFFVHGSAVFIVIGPIQKATYFSFLISAPGTGVYTYLLDLPPVQ
jgi:hypothetical protein